MRFKPHHLIAAFLPLSLTGCAGTFGTLAWRTWNDQGTRVTEVRSIGFESRNLPGYRGISLGQRVTTYVNRLSNTDQEEASGWGYISLPNETPLFTQSITIGSDLAFEPSYIGMTLGATSRSCAVLELGQSSTLQIHTSPTSSGHFSFQQLP